MPRAGRVGVVQVVPGLTQDSTASHQTLPERSRASNGRLPIAWQIELIDQVTWCSSATRTRLPQKNAVSAPYHDLVTRPPMSGGRASERDATSG